LYQLLPSPLNEPVIHPPSERVSANFAMTAFYEVCLSTRNASATLKIPLGEIRSWGRLALRQYLRVPPENNVIGERSEHANSDMAAGVVTWRRDNFSGRVDEQCSY
jgi:hypothetical protein